MVSYEPAESGQNGTLTLGIGIAFEVPDTGGGSNNKFSATNDESINPEEHKHLEEESIFGQVCPFNFS
jgi:hypothetical protein